MAERDRPDDDDDLEFEFFDEPRTVEEPTRTMPPLRRPGGQRPPGPGPVRPRTPGAGTPIVRLAALIGGAIVVAVLIVVGITSCRGGGSKGDYADYLQSVAGVTSKSNDIGKQFTQLLSQTGLSLDDLQTGLAGLAEQQAQVVATAKGLAPPGTLLDAQQSLVDAMQFRENGLRGMEQAVAQIEPSTDPDTAGRTLAEQANRLVAGDVVYTDSFQARTEAVLKQEGVSGVAVPRSSFLSDPEIVSVTSLTGLIERIQGRSGGETAGGKHGNGIEAVTVLPSGDELPSSDQTAQDTEINVSTDFAIQVAVQNSGDFQETNVVVRLTIQGEPAIKKKEIIPIIQSGETKTVVFKDFVDLPYGTPTTVKVVVEKVPGETNTANNSRDYPVIFTFAQ